MTGEDGSCSITQRSCGESGIMYELNYDDLIDRWHNGEGRGIPLYEFLGMTKEEYEEFVEREE